VGQSRSAENRFALGRRADEAKRENIKLRAELRRVKEERDILKKAARYLAQDPE